MHNVHGNNCQSDFCKCFNVVSARSGHCLQLLICDYDELHETMLEFLLTIKNPRARALHFPLIHALSLSLSVFLSLSVVRFGLLLACSKTKQAAEAATAAVKFQQRPGPGCLAGVQHAHCKRLSHATHNPNTHAPSQMKAAQRRCSNQRALLVFIMATKRRPGQHHQRSCAGEALAVLI